MIRKIIPTATCETIALASCDAGSIRANAYVRVPARQDVSGMLQAGRLKSCPETQRGAMRAAIFFSRCMRYSYLLALLSLFVLLCAFGTSAFAGEPSEQQGAR